MDLVVEYLVITQKSGSFCDSKGAFNRLLEVDSAITINSGRISCGDEFSCDYGITAGEVSSKEQRYFHLRMMMAADETSLEVDVDRFTFFLKRLRGIISRASGQVETLWDDISYLYSRKSYPPIYDIENLMRKLIANFMLVTVGKEWVSEASPSERRDVITKSKRKTSDYVNVLHAVDFRHLADFLTKPYSRYSTSELHEAIENATSPEELETLKDYVPRSNWDRY